MKNIITSLESSTLEGYVPTMLQYHTISQCHYHPISTYENFQLLCSCLPLSSCLTLVSTPSPSPFAPFHGVITETTARAVLLPILSCEEGTPGMFSSFGRTEIGSAMRLDGGKQ